MLSRIVGKLEHAGLLHRRPDPDDGRAARVEPSPQAGAELQPPRQRAERTRLLADRLATLPTAARARPCWPRCRPSKRSPPARSPRAPVGPPLIGTLPAARPSPRWPTRTTGCWFAGQSVSLAGTWMQMIAQSWLVLELTCSGTAIGAGRRAADAADAAARARTPASSRTGWTSAG